MSKTTSTTEYLSRIQSIAIQDCITINFNTNLLNINFEIVKQCLKRVALLEGNINQFNAQQQSKNNNYEERIKELERKVIQQNTKFTQQQNSMKDLQNKLSEDLINKINGLQEKVKSHQDIDELIDKIQSLNKFVSIQSFKSFEEKTAAEIDEVTKLKDQFIDKQFFHDFKDETQSQLGQKSKLIDALQLQTSKLGKNIETIGEKASKISNEMSENNRLIKEINLRELLDKLQQIKEDTDHKIGQFGHKLKKKVGSHELNQLEKGLIERLDQILSQNSIQKADLNETKQALIFLEKKVNQITDFLASSNSNQEKEGLFATRKWMCASCTKDLGKYEGKLGQYRPWAVFPCRQHNPQNSGGFGYLNYVDKLSYKRGEADDSNLERLSKTFYQTHEPEVNSNKKLNTTRGGSSLLAGFGNSPSKNSTSLKQQYFKLIERQKGKSSSRGFRLKKNLDIGNKPSTAQQKVKQI